jgi:hypothetical protein
MLLNASLPNAFSRMIQNGQPLGLIQNTIQRDRCSRLILTYNVSYDPFRSPLVDLPLNYSPYKPRELLFDDWPIIVLRIP